MVCERLIRFIGEDGEYAYGEPMISSPEEFHEHLEKGILKARTLHGLERR
jgi:hypothetical protein